MTSCDVVLVLTILLVHVVLTEASTKCKKDEDISDQYKDNIYYCDDTDKPQCCIQEKQPTCCEAAADKSLKNQFELWGILGVVVVAVAFVLVCWRKDTYMCEGSTMKERCSNLCNCRKKKSIDDGSIELTVTKNSSKYFRDRSTPVPNRESTTVTSVGIEPIFTSQQELHMSDVDSGRGSVTSSTPPSHDMTSHSAKSTKSNFIALNDYGPVPTETNTAVMIDKPADGEMQTSTKSAKSTKDKKKKSKKKKKKAKKVKQKFEDSDSEGEDEVKV